MYSFPCRFSPSKPLRLPSSFWVLSVIAVLLLAGPPPLQPQHPGASSSPPSISRFLPLFFITHLKPLFLDFGILSVSAAPCSQNICANGGACYEHAGAQVCVCAMPYKGPTCAERASLCTSDCGIRVNTGVDCSSALCSLGTCTDTDTSPFFKCDCGDFFAGYNCEVPTNPCTSVVNPCGQATCIFAPGRGTGTVTCECKDDWEVAPGAGLVTTKWGNSEVVMNPPCSVRVSRGIARISFSLSSGELILWWTVFAFVLCLLLWCCYSVGAESCGAYFRKLRFVGGVQKAAGA